MVWYDNDYLYIKAEEIKEILKLQNCDVTFNNCIKAILAEKDLIKKIIKKDGKPEYSVHIQKNLYPVHKSDSDDKKNITKKRYVAFNRMNCKQYNLFEKIEEIILKRCQIDVKVEKNKEPED